MIIIFLSFFLVVGLVFLFQNKNTNEVYEENEQLIQEPVYFTNWLPDFSCPEDDEFMSFDEIEEFLKDQVILERLQKYSYGY